MVDKKSQHVGNHDGKYTDLDGMSRQFTYIDHDVKTRISTSKISDQEKEDLLKSVQNDIDKQINIILALPAVSAVINTGGEFEELIERNPDKGIIWRENMVREMLTINSMKRHNLSIIAWRNTVKEQYWFEDMPYEDIIKGKWKDLV